MFIITIKSILKSYNERADEVPMATLPAERIILVVRGSCKRMEDPLVGCRIADKEFKKVNNYKESKI